MFRMGTILFPCVSGNLHVVEYTSLHDARPKKLHSRHWQPVLFVSDLSDLKGLPATNLARRQLAAQGIEWPPMNH